MKLSLGCPEVCNNASVIARFAFSVCFMRCCRGFIYVLRGSVSGTVSPGEEAGIQGISLAHNSFECNEDIPIIGTCPAVFFKYWTFAGSGLVWIAGFLLGLSCRSDARFLFFSTCELVMMFISD